MSPCTQDTDSPQLKFVFKWGQGFDKGDLAAIAECMHKDFRHKLYPASLGKPEQTKEEFLADYGRVVGLTADSKVSYLSYYSELCRG